MKCSSKFIPYLSFKVALLPLTTALIEPDADTKSHISNLSFVDTSAIPPLNTIFFEPSEFGDDSLGFADAPNSLVTDLLIKEQNLGADAGSSRIDGRTGKISTVYLKKPILPGDGVGNHLLWSVGPSAEEGGHDPPSSSEEWSKLCVEAVKNWMIDHQLDLSIDATNELFPSTPNVFSLNLQDGDEVIYTQPTVNNIRTAVHGDDGDMIQVSMQRTFKGIKVVDSRATATVKRGNLVNVGLETWGDIDETFHVRPRLDEKNAYRALAMHTGLTLTDEITCKPELQIITIAQGEVSSALRPVSKNIAKLTFGQGYGHRLVWKICPKFEGQDIEMMEGVVDAMTGSVLSFQDTVDYFEAKGDVYPFSNDGIGPEGKSQDGWPMPFMEIGTGLTDTGGNFNKPGSQTAKLTGSYVEMRDMCGWGSIYGNRQYGIAEITQSNGIDWGGSEGTDCTTPGFGGPSNTHSSRSGFYELNKIIEIARSRLPSNSWLQSKLISWMNIDASCNAYWNGQVNFYRSSSSCANTGELAGVFDHEVSILVGHGMDNNDVDGKIAKPSGEGIADIYTALRLNDSCIGRGFYKNGKCSGNGNACLSCSGVRDIDYMERVNKSPSTYTWARQACGTSVHCLGYVYSEAVWSLYKRTLNFYYGYDENTSLEIVTRLTYIAAGNTYTWYNGYSQSPSGIWKGGCGTNSGYLSFLAADDDNGNVNDGTPHMEAIFKAFNDQEIACDSPTVQDSGCDGTPTDSPNVTIVGDNMKATLTWTAVAGAFKYQVFRTEGLNQCGQGKVLLATVDSNIRSYTDEGLANKREYYYIVIPKGSNDACFGPSSDCAAVIPDSGPSFEILCENDSLIIPADPTKSSVKTRDCTLYGTGGFSGSVSLGCDSSALSGVTCVVSPSSLAVSTGISNAVVSIEASSSVVAGTGTIKVSGTSGSIVSSSTIPVTILAAGGPQIAYFDTSYGAPFCPVWGSECSSGTLLTGRGTLTGANEPNYSNTIDGCEDGHSGTYQADESIEKIVVRSGWTSGEGSGQPMIRGSRATIIASVYSYNLGSSDYADFYYASDDNPYWTYIATKQPDGGGFKDIMVDYELPPAYNHMVRVNFRYNGGPSSCTVGSYNDHDDLVFTVTDSATSIPATPSPSNKPTLAPTNTPTRKPTRSPTPIPTLKPSNPPTIKPTNAPSNEPTLAPTPVTSGGDYGIQEATFDVALGAPRCTSPSKACLSGSLLIGRGYMSDGTEPNTANTLDDCVSDGNSGTHHKDESIDAIKVSSVDGEVLTAGKTADIEATVFAWSSGASDMADFYFTDDASNPVWQYIDSVKPPGGGEHVLKVSYTLPEGENQAVRVQFRFGGTIGTCTNGRYNDRDDLVFTVASAPDEPTQAPVKTQAPNDTVGGGPQQALYDSDLGVPRCNLYSSECNSLDLLDGRGLMKNGNEVNAPNTLDVCQDGNSGKYHVDESIDKIVVRSGEVDGSGSEIDMIEGGRSTIVVTVHPWRSGVGDYADFYYTGDALNPQWTYLGTMQPIGSGLQELKMAYTLPEGTHQAVRVTFRYKGTQVTNGACSKGSFDDNDDLAFTVKSNPSFTNNYTVDEINFKESKNTDEKIQRGSETLMNEKRRRKKAKATNQMESEHNQ